MVGATEVEIVKSIYDGLNRNDIPAAMKFFDPQAVRIEWEGSPAEGVFRGLSEITAHFAKGRSTWAEGSCEPEQLIPAGDKIIVPTHVQVRLKDKTEWLDGHTGDVFVFRNGKVIEFRTFMTPDEAFKWAGQKSSLN